MHTVTLHPPFHIVLKVDLDWKMNQHWDNSDATSSTEQHSDMFGWKQKFA